MYRPMTFIVSEERALDLVFSEGSEMNLVPIHNNSLAYKLCLGNGVQGVDSWMAELKLMDAGA